MSSATEAAIWERVIHPHGELTPETARAILQLKFSAPDRHRMHALAQKAQEGSLSPEEAVEIDDYERVGTMLSILKSRARKLLKRKSPRRGSSK